MTHPTYQNPSNNIQFNEQLKQNNHNSYSQVGMDFNQIVGQVIKTDYRMLNINCFALPIKKRLKSSRYKNKITTYKQNKHTQKVVYFGWFFFVACFSTFSFLFQFFLFYFIKLLALAMHIWKLNSIKLNKIKVDTTMKHLSIGNGYQPMEYSTVGFGEHFSLRVVQV